jgi:hypothetical protein
MAPVVAGPRVAVAVAGAGASVAVAVGVAEAVAGRMHGVAGQAGTPTAQA